MTDPGAAKYEEDYLQAYTLKSWLLTTDHKRIGLLYMASITFFFFVGGAAALTGDAFLEAHDAAG